MVAKLDLLYELHADEEHIRAAQTDGMNGYGLSTSPYLFGNNEWRAALEAGSIERRTAEGTITDPRRLVGCEVVTAMADVVDMAGSADAWRETLWDRWNTFRQ